MATSRAELLAASQKDVDSLSTITKKLVCDNKLQETVSELNKRQLNDLWDEVMRMCMVAIIDQGEKGDDNQDIAQSVVALECVTNLAAVTVASVVGVGSEDEENQDKGQVAVPGSLQETVIILHGILLSLPADQAKLKDQMCQLFEAWWINDLPGKNEVVVNTLCYLLTKSTDQKASQTDITRLWKLHEMLSFLDIDGPDAASLVPLFRRCLVHHHFISTSNGLKFLVHLFCLSSTLTEKLHSSVKNNLLETPKSWHSKYGEVYFRAWQKASNDPELKQKLEEGCIQDLMFKAVHLPRRGTNSLASILFRVLNYFHKQKSQRGVEAMLTQLYEPVLWRSLKVANCDVRCNAAALMFDVFPLQGRPMNAEESDKLLQRQFDNMHQLLTDNASEVRLVAVKGVGKLLGLYWELIPSQVIQCLVTTLVQELAYDISSPSVREAVIHVMSNLCDNHLCIPMLKRVLPEFKNFVHDTAECVRIAMFDLLLKIKGLRAIKFWAVVPVEHILARLEDDTHYISKRIMKLIGTSFVPLDQPPAEQIDRCLTLIKGNPGAARQFFLRLPEHVSVQDCAKLIVLLCRYALETVRQQNASAAAGNQSVSNDPSLTSPVVSHSLGKKSRPSPTTRRSRSSTGEASNLEKSTAQNTEEGADTEDVPLSAVLTSVVEAIYLMYQGVFERLDPKDDKEMKEGLAKKLCVTVREMMGFSEDDRLDNALIALAGNLPSRGLPLFSQNLVNRLKKLGASPAGAVNTSVGGTLKPSGASIILKALVLQGQAEPVFDMIRDSLKKAVAEGEEDEDRLEADKTKDGGEKKQKKKKKAVGFAVEETNIPPLTAISWLIGMLNHIEGQPMLLKRHGESLMGLTQDMQPVLSHLRSLLLGDASTPPVSVAETLIHTYTTYLRLLLFLKANPFPSDGLTKQSTDHSAAILKSLQGAFGWTQYVLLQGLKNSKDNVIKKKVCVRLLEAGLKACNCLMLVGCPDDQLTDTMIDLFMGLTRTDCPYQPSVVAQVLACLYQMTQLRHHHLIDDLRCQNSEQQSQQQATQGMSSVVSGCVTQCIYQVLESACHHFVLNVDEDLSRDDKARAFSQESSAFSCLFQELTGPGRSIDSVQKLITAMLDCMLKELAHCSQDDALPKGSNPPPLCSALLAAVKRRLGNKTIFLHVIDQYISKEDLSDLHQIHGLVYLINVFKSYPGVDVSLSIEKGLQTVLRSWKDDGDDAVMRSLHKELTDEVGSWISLFD